MANKWWNMFKMQWKLGFYIFLTGILIIAGIIIANALKSDKSGVAEIEIEDTPILIDSIMPKGDLYVGSAIIEDYATEKRTERQYLVMKKEHTCVQIVKQKCSFKIDLDKVEYQLQDNNVVLVKMPELEYIATTQASPFTSDDEEYWMKEMPNTNGLKKKVAKQIEARFNTKENRRKSVHYAEEAVQELLRKLGYKAEFVPHLEQDIIR